MNALQTALTKQRARITTLHSQYTGAKAAGTIDLGMGGGESMGGNIFASKAGSERYSLFRGWVYAAINAIASEAAGQPVNIATLKGGTAEAGERRSIPQRKELAKLRKKSAEQEWELLYDHPLMEALDNPNPIQGRWQFTYSFIANLCLTGWAYVVGGVGPEGKLEYYSLPTTWITPIHSPTPFAKFKIQDPSKAASGSEGVILERENVGFAHLPNPANPLGALSPSGAQVAAIRIDDHIQTSQERFFENGIFPSVIVTVGKDPHPDHNPAGGIRPRLSGEQRRQVVGAIRKVMSGVSNYGNPAIVDGLIEKIERVSATSTEMGWDKSEDKVRTRILSAFGVHPYILGEPVSVGGYAQAAKIEERFCKRVNTYLEMLSNLMTSLSGLAQSSEKIYVWWEPCASSDPSLRSMNLREARKNGDITKNELRAELGFPPDDSGIGSDTRAPLLDTVGGMTGYVSIATAVGQGMMSAEAAAIALATFLQIDVATAASMIGSTVVPTAPVATLPSPAPEEDEEGLEPDEGGDVLEGAVAALNAAVKALEVTPSAAASLLDAASR